MNATIKKPVECSAHELQTFEFMVREGEEVTAVGLSQRIRDAAFLMFLTAPDGSLIGVSALKHPNPGYRADAFQRAQSKLQPDHYALELGWVFVSESQRGHGLSHILVEQLLPHAGVARVYATTRESNLPMRRTNERYGFRREGDSYPSKLGDHTLLLYVRPPS